MRVLHVGVLLCSFAIACSSPGGGRGEGTDVGGGTTFADASSSGSSEADTSGDEGPEPTTASVTTGLVTGEPETTDAPMTTTSPTTGLSTTGEADTGTTTDEPPNDCPRVRVAVDPGEVLNVRPTPSTAMDPVGQLPSGALVDVLEVVQGEAVEGNPEWYRIKSPMIEGYVWGGLVECTADEPSNSGFYLPLECGKAATVSQGNFGDFSHQGQSAYAFDFSLGIGTPLVAIADGTVSQSYGETMPGDPCYNGGGQECSAATNYVTLLHDDGTKSIYAHLSQTSVATGDFVPRGSVVGLSGSTGWSTGPHAHVAREEGCGGGWCQSIAVNFADVPGDGVPKTGDMVVSGNCP